MSQQVPQQPSAPDAARGDVPSAPSADRPLPGFPQHPVRPAPGPHAQIEREIERSERASAALAATRALARAAFTDSQLAADDENASSDADIDTSGWVRTEYAALDHSVRAPQDDVPHAGAPHNLVGGSFNPGIAFQSVRSFPGASMAQAPIKTRGGAQARFLHEARQAPRPERGIGGAPRAEHSLGHGAGLYDKPAVLPMLATPGASPVTRPSAGARTPASARARGEGSSGETLRFALAAGLGAVVVLIGGGVAWKAGWLARSSPTAAALVTPAVATQAEAARVMAAAQQEIALVPPAAGTPPARSDQEADAALAAAARAAAVPVASVHAAGPAHLAPAPVAPARAASAAHPSPHVGKDGVAAAIAEAQARADRFLSSGGAAPAAPKPQQ